MKSIEKLKTVKEISEKLLEQYSHKEIDLLLNDWGVKISEQMNYEETYDYLKRLLFYPENEAKLDSILEEIESTDLTRRNSLPKTWENTDSIKLFISHISPDKDIAKRLQTALNTYNISSFVAHEDIQPTKDWEKEIDSALRSMDVFVSLQTKGFENSMWCQQEVGMAVMRGKKIIPIIFNKGNDENRGEVPTGFLAGIQAMTRNAQKEEGLAKEIVDLLKSDERTQAMLDKKIIKDSDFEDDIPF